VNPVEVVSVQPFPTQAKEEKRMPVLKNTALSRRVFVVVCTLFAMTATTLILPAEDAWAAKKTKWLSSKIVKWQVRKNKNVSPNNPGYLELYVEIQHKNNSIDKTITKLHNKSLATVINI
jgi:hypothetical protein